MKTRAKVSAVPKRLVVANWKMNPGTLAEAKALFLDIKKEASRRARVQTVISAPYPYVFELHKLAAGSRTLVGAQNVFWKKEGTYTGEVSAPMLASVGVSYVIVGHSERRALGETDEQVAKKVTAVIRGGLSVVLCVGESERDTSGRYLNVIETQIRTALLGVPKTVLGQLSIAYEPVWAISGGDGKGKTATPGDIHEMTIFIRKVLTSVYSRSSAERVRILYGGSVNEDNAQALMQEGMADGFLVGGASLKPRAFAAILTAANAVANEK